MKQAKWLKSAYRGTHVNWAKTQVQVYKLLGDLGIYEIRFTNLRDRFALEFLITLEEGEKPRAVRIIVPINQNPKDENARQKELNTIHRILFNHLKAKFIAIANGVTEFEKEFMAHLIITDAKGNSTTMGEAMLPQYKKHLESGNGEDFKLLGDGKD